MIDRETGYDDEPVCSCRPCKKCDGEGEIPSLIDFREGTYPGAKGPDGDSFVVLETEKCTSCNGTGKDTSECEIEAHWPADEQAKDAAFRATHPEAA